MSDTRGWDDYWTGSSSGVAFSQEGADHPALDHFWRDTLSVVKPGARILDLASGRGALIRYLPEAEYRSFYSLDYSKAALASQREHFPFVQPVVADLAALPFGEGQFDFIISQFGVDYGGADAIDSVPCLLAAGGRLALVMHCQGSVIARECSVNVEALARLQALQFIPMAETMFRAGYAVLRGETDRQAAIEAAQALLEPFRGLGGLLQQYGEGVAGGTILTLYRETARIQERIQNHVEEEVIGWLQTLGHEISRYEARMQSMLDAALTEEQFKQTVTSFRQSGIEVLRADILKTQAGEPLAWILTGNADD